MIKQYWDFINICFVVLMDDMERVDIMEDED